MFGHCRRAQDRMSVSIDITDKVTPMLNRVGAGLRTGALENVMGRAGANAVQNHFFTLNTKPNQLGGRRTNFWAAAAKSTSYTSAPGEVTINVNKQGVRQQYQGGTIKPVRRKYLTIPAAPEAHGRRASEFSNLR